MTVRDRSIFIGGLGPVHFKFSIEKKCMSYLTKTQKKLLSYIKSEIKMNVSYKKKISFKFLLRSFNLKFENADISYTYY